MVINMFAPLPASLRRAALLRRALPPLIFDRLLPTPLAPPEDILSLCLSYLAVAAEGNVQCFSLVR